MPETRVHHNYQQQQYSNSDEPQSRPSVAADVTSNGEQVAHQSSTLESSQEHLTNQDVEPLIDTIETSHDRSNLDSHRASTIAEGPIRVPGTYPPDWLPDSEANACMACDNLFTLIKRRHHCRSCGKIFCSECCRQKAKLLYLDNREARVCNNCFHLIFLTLSGSDINNASVTSVHYQDYDPSPSSSNAQVSSQAPVTKVQGVLKTSNQSRNTSSVSNEQCNTSASSSSDYNSNKQVIFADGIRPGTDLSEPFPYPIPSSSSADSSSTPFSLLTRQSIVVEDTGASTSKKSKNGGPKNRASNSQKNITVCDELGYLPPIVISKDSLIANTADDGSASSSNPLTSLIMNQFKASVGRKTIQASMESRSCPLNGVVKFVEISSLVGVNNVITFLLLRDFYLKVKLIKKDCCTDCNQSTTSEELSLDCRNADEKAPDNERKGKFSNNESQNRYWCFTSVGLDKFGQNEIVLVIDKDKDDSCIPRDIFKIYLTLHELALRRQSLDHLGNLLFQDGLFGTRDTAGLLFVRPTSENCLENLILPDNKPFLVALVLQRWEVPWAKIFPMRLLLRLGHKFDTYPFPLISYRTREPVYYEVGHTIISILGDFRNFRYSITHVDGLKVMLKKTSRKIVVQLSQSNYQQFNKVLDSSNNEHVLAWSSCPFPEADGHLVSVQNDDGQYETVEYLKKFSDQKISFKNLESGATLGASFIIFSGALKVNQSGQPAKISVVEDGLLIQIQSCTMSALKNAIHFMHHFDIDCENSQDAFNRVEIDWVPEEAELQS